MFNEFQQRVEASPIIAAVKDDEGLAKCLEAEVDIVFILYGTIVTLPDIVDKIKANGRCAVVHLDLIQGLSPREVSVDYVRNCTKADGIITTRSGLVRHAKESGLGVVLRYFLLDSMALSNIERQEKELGRFQPDLIEVLPGIVVPKLIREVVKRSRVPVIAGGLISEREDVMNALESGCVAISTTNQNVWFM